MDQQRRGLSGWCAATVLVSAFLLFQVQPMLSKMILPWFGGSPAVWTTCMLFFQLFLLLGYLYAYLLDRLPEIRWQAALHVMLLVLALWSLPIVPEPEWKPTDSGQPQWRILLLLTANVGLPYLLLASSAPLLQAWYSRATAGRMPYRFYALSNIGSLVALLSYPFWIEPTFDVPGQGALWSSGFFGFAILCGGMALAVARWNVPKLNTVAATDQSGKNGLTRPRLRHYFVWLALPAFGSMSLLAVTNQICQDVAVVPFLWVAPLSLYLITFILCFDSELWYRRSVFGVASLVAVLAIAIVLFRDNVQPLVDEWDYIFVAAQVETPTIPDFLDSITLEIVLYLAAMFGVCMLCHGELVRCKPNPRYLTLFYLCLSAGGALGGMFVALLCPLVFPDYIESYIFLVGGALLGLFVLFDSWTLYERRWRRWWQALVTAIWLFASGLVRTVLRRPVEGEPARQIRMAKSASLAWRGRPWYTLASLLVPVPVFAVLLLLYHAAEWPRDLSLVSRRSFYGVLHVSQYDLDTDDQRRNLYNGRILHGIQLTAPGRSREPTTYYNPDSGVGLTLLNLAQLQGPLRVATVGLGTGTIAAYGQAGDYYCFYEINPDVIDIAHDYFTFLGDSPAQVEVVEGDARLSMERQAPQGYDVIALDAFSGDAIPAHLLTVEAVATYLRHLKPSGVLAVHTSNRHLDLVPIATLLAIHHGLQIVSVDCDDYGGIADSSSEWLLMTRNEEFLSMPDVDALSQPLQPPGDEIRVWTDQYSNLFQILRNWHEDEDEDEE